MILLNCCKTSFWGPKPYKFLSIWTLQEDFQQVVKQASSVSVVGDPTMKALAKLWEVKLGFMFLE